MSEKVLRVVFRVTSWLPMAALLCLYTFALAATIQRGHFPKAWIDDPKYYTGLDVLYHGVYVLALLSEYASPLWLGLFLYYWLDKIPMPRFAWLYPLGWALILVQLFLDPFELLRWYAD